MTFSHFFPLSTTLSRLFFFYSFGILVAFSHTATSFAKSGARNLKSTANIPRVYVTHPGQKIESDPASPILIKTEPGIGYRFISNEAF